MKEIRTPFVGRAAEMEFLGKALADAQTGKGRFVSIPGDVGMGKTRLILEIAEIAGRKGFEVLWSPMIEDPAAPPFALWVPALRACIERMSVAEMEEHLEPRRAELGALLPELQDHAPPVQALDSLDSPAARFQLFDAVSRFLLRLSKRRACLILFDNLHIADRSSLALLTHISQRLAGHSILILGAYRDAELSRRHPLRPALNTLARGADHAQLVMKGMNHHEVAELLHRLLGTPCPASIVKAIQEQSGGNPLFVTEVGHMLSQQPMSDQIPAPGFHFRVPTSLNEVISTRLDRLPVQTCRLLETAAVLGREFDVRLLSELAGLNSARVAEQLEPAEAQGVISQFGPGQMWFQHALFREVLYSELNAVSRATLHRKAGESIEGRYSEDVHEQCAQLAYHFFEAAHSLEDTRAVKYCRKAAEAAWERRAYVESAAMYERALQVANLKPSPDLAQRFDLLCAMGRAQYASGQMNASTQSLMKAAVLAYRQKWWGRLADALFLFQHLCQQSGLRHVASVPLHQAALENLAAEAIGKRARVYVSLAKAYRTAARPEQAVEAFHQGVELARQCEDERVLLDCLRKGAWSIGRHPRRVAEGLEVSQEALALAKRLGPIEAVLDALTDIAFQLCELGDVPALERTLAELRSIARQERQVHFLNLLAGFETALAVLQGRWKDAMNLAKSAVEQVPQLGVYGLEGRYAFQVFAIRKATGALGGTSETLAMILETHRDKSFWSPGQILLHCELGQTDAARKALDALGDLNRLPQDDLYAISLVYLAESCVRLRDTGRCRTLYSLLEPYRSLNATLAGSLMLGSVTGFMAELCVILKRNEEAGSLFEEAIEMNAAMNAWPALARNKVEYARLLFSRDPAAHEARARQLISQARAIAEKHSLHPLLASIEDIDDQAGANSLTQREIQILKLLASGKSNKHIAATLHISHSTVATHVRHILRKTGASNRTEAADHARKAELLG